MLTVTVVGLPLNFPFSNCFYLKTVYSVSPIYLIRITMYFPLVLYLLSGWMAALKSEKVESSVHCKPE